LGYGYGPQSQEVKIIKELLEGLRIQIRAWSAELRAERPTGCGDVDGRSNSEDARLDRIEARLARRGVLLRRALSGASYRPAKYK